MSIPGPLCSITRLFIHGPTADTHLTKRTIQFALQQDFAPMQSEELKENKNKKTLEKREH